MKYRKITRVERDTGPHGAYDATFYECGHMDRYAPGLGPRVGDERRCHACKTVTPVIDRPVKDA